MLVATVVSCDFLPGITPGGEQPGGEQPGGEQPGGEETPEIKTYTVSFNTDGAGDIAAVTVEEGNAVAEPTAPAKAGYTFLGWYNGDAEYDFTAVVAADLTLTAKWEANQYTLTVGETAITVTYGQPVGTLPEIEEREGYDGKWTIGDADLTAETVYLFTEDMTAEAEYTIKTYTVTYTANGEIRETVTVEHGATATDPGEIVEGGYHVAGWTLNGEAYDFATEVKSDIELVAVVEPNKYTLTVGETPIEVTYGTAVGDLPAVPEQEGYDGKWTLNGEDLTAETVYNFTEDLAAEAAYTIKTYTVVLKVNGETYNTVTVEHGSTVTAPDANIVVGAYYVSGWTLDGVAYDFATPVKSDLEIVAVTALWDPSYGTAKNSYSYYISDFNNASVMNGITIGAPHSPWFNELNPIPANGIVNQGTYSLVNGAVQGLNLSQTVDDYAGFGYTLPTALDLSGVETIAVRVGYNNWSANYANFYIIFKSGDTYVNAINYATQYNTYAEKFDNVTPETLNKDSDGTTNTLTANFRECWVEIDVAALMAATGMTSIDTIYFCQKNTGFNCTIDEIYYTVPHEDVSYDPSYMTQKGENSYYISDFNSATVIDGVTQDQINPWGNWGAVKGNTVAQGSITNGHGTHTGLTFKQESTAATYGSITYTFPSAFDLAQAETIVFKISTSGWHNGYANAFILLKSGAKYVNVNSYMKFYNGTDMSGTPVTTTEAVFNINYLTGFVEVDVAALIEGAGITSIDGIVFGANNVGFSHVIDEIYYTVK